MRAGSENLQPDTAEKTHVAIITGGSSGLGHAVAKALASRGGWQIALFDRDAVRGQTAVKEVLGATFYQVDVTDYTSLAQAFKTVFQSHGRLDFVFANAGIAMAAPVDVDTAAPPPAPDTSMIDINLHGAINTSHLAMYYLAKTGRGGDLVFTASSAGLYASAASPAYCASKHGVVGWTRSIAPAALREHGIHVNAICPGIMRTNILPDAVFEMFPAAMLTPVAKAVEVVLMILDHEDGRTTSNVVIEICGDSHYFRDQVEFCNETMAAMMGVVPDQ